MPTLPENTKLLLQAAAQGNLDEVWRLIPLSDPKANYSCALDVAAQNGHTSCVELLVPISDPKAGNSFALRWAAANGHTSCVDLLIPVSDPKAQDSSALQFAIAFGHTECVDLLYPISDPVVALQKMQQKHHDNYNLWGQLQQMVDAERVRNTLNAEVENATAIKVQRKM